MADQDFVYKFSFLLQTKKKKALREISGYNIPQQEQKIEVVLESVKILADKGGFSHNAINELSNHPFKRTDKFPELIRIGVLHDKVKEYRTLALLSLDKSKAFAFAMEKSMYDEGSFWLQRVVLRVVASLEARLCHLYLVDTIGLGEHFSTLAELSNKIIFEGAVCDDDGIEKLFSDLSAHIRNIGQNYLKSKYNTLHSYNEFMVQEKQPYKLVVIYGFPNAFTSQARFDALQKLIVSGQKAGVYVLMTIDKEIKFPHFINKVKFFQNLILINRQNGIWQIENSLLGKIVVQNGWSFVPDTAPLSDLDKLIEKINHSIEKSLEVTINMNDIFSFSITQDRLIDDDLLLIPFGKSDNNQITTLKISVSHKDGGKHSLLLGTTGVGKSALLHTLILSAAWRYSPQDLEFYLFDFGQGTGFNIYRKLPHAKMVFISSELAFGIPMLEKLIEIMKERGKLFRQNNVDDLVTYRNIKGKKMPTILVVIDEFQAIVDNGTAGRRGSKIFDKIATEGRKFGIFLILSTQTLDDVNISSQANNNISTRIALQLSSSKSDPYRMLGDEYSDQIKKLKKEGEGFLVQKVGYSEPIHFHSLYIDNKKRITMVEQLSKKYQIYVQDNFVFDGTTSACVLENPLLFRKGKELASTAVKIYLGTPTVPHKEDIWIQLESILGANVLCVGRKEDALVQIILLMVVQITLNYEKKQFFIDGSIFEDRIKQKLEDFIRAFGGTIKWLDDERKLDDYLDELLLTLGEEDVKKVFFLADIFRFNTLRNTGGQISAVFQKLQILLTTAPEKNLHTFLHINNVPQWEQTALNMIDPFHFQNRIYLANHGSRLYDFDEEDRAMIVSPNYKTDVSYIDSSLMQGMVFKVYMDIFQNYLQKGRK
jgi:hypothetical protein